jgi:hypothetical protein
MAVVKTMNDHYATISDLVNKKYKWDAFNAVLDRYIEMHFKKLEQSTELADIYRAQGSIEALKRLKLLKEEVNGTN